MPTILPKPSANPSFWKQGIQSHAIQFALALAVLTLVLRFAPLPENFATFGALSLFCGLFLTGPARWFLPLAVLFVADTIGHFGNVPGMGFYHVPSMFFNYLGFAIFSLAGSVLSKVWDRHRFSLNASLATVPAAAFAGSLIFFLISNFGAWLDPRMGYEATLRGLGQCYWMGLPFWRWTLASDLIFSVGFVAMAYGVSLWLARQTKSWA